MTNVLVQPDRASFTNDEAYRDAQQMYGLLTGQTAWGAPTSFTSLDDDAVYSMTIQNQGTGGHINVPGLFLVNDSGVNAGVIDVTTLNVSDTATIETLHVEGDTDLDGTLNVDGATTLNGATTIDDTLQVTGAVDLDSTLTVDGNTALGNGNADTLTVIGISTFRNAANTATQMYVDAGNNRVIVGTSTPLGSDTAPNLQVVGRLYVAPETANDLAIEVRRSSATATGFRIGVASTNDLVFKDDTDTEVFRVGDGGSAYQAKVTGDLNVTGDATVAGLNAMTTGILIAGGGLTLAGPTNIDGNGGTAGELRIGAGIFGAVSLSGSEKLRVAGTAVVDSTMTVNGEASAKTPQVAAASGALSLSTTMTDISGASVSLTPGNWIVSGVFFFAESGAGDVGQNLLGQLVTSGGTATISNSTSLAVFNPQIESANATVTQTWYVSVTATTTAKLQAKKNAGTGASVASATHTTITAAFVGKP